MRRALRLHPDCRRDAVSRIDVDVTRTGPGRLELAYVLSGRMADVVLPPAGEPGRADELWQHTCLELFLKPAGGRTYREFNFAPSRQWAAYGFDDYRLGRRPIDAAPEILVAARDDRFEMTVTLDLPWLTEAAAWKLALTAVVEESGGHIFYWALNHPPGKADFHHADGFALELQGLP